MKTFSLYRGQARDGIGEGLDHSVHHGEQYLAADEPLDGDGELLNAARPWMTLDWRPADEQALGQQIEGWSYFPYGDYRFVVRLAAAGIYDRRAAYFAHGRAFPVADFAGARDPGAWLGASQAFDEPWNDAKRPEPRVLGEPELVRPAEVQAEPAVAGALLAHLYQGLVSGYPVVMAVPVKDFAREGPLHALVSFARAALPLNLKRDCRIRVFTRLPELFLRHLETDLLVIPESEAANALAARRDATLLDRTGARREGRELAWGATKYAEAVLTWFLRAPGELLAYSGTISEHLLTDRLPGEIEIARVPAIYLLLNKRKEPSSLGEWIKSRLLKNLSEQPTGLPWDRLIRPEDWQGLSSEDLGDIALADIPGKEAQAIVGLAKAEAFRRKLFSPDALQKRWDGDQLAAAAGRDPQIAADLARTVCAGALSGDRVRQLLRSAEVRDHLDTATLLGLADADSPLGTWMDCRISNDPSETVTALLRADRWRQWRTGSSLRGESLRNAALAWLTSEAWQRPAPAKRLEDWRQVVEDLGSLTGAEIAKLRTGISRRFGWPWITPFQDEQLRDLCRLAGRDFGALTELAEGIDPEHDLRYRLKVSVIEHILDLADPEVREGLPPEVLRTAEHLPPRERSQKLISAIRSWEKEKRSPRQPAGAVRRQVALHPAVQALLQGSAQNGCWKTLADDVRLYVKGDRPAHPVARLAADLREVFPQLQPEERKALEEKGWRAFSAAALARPALLRHPIVKGEPLPALEVAALLRSREGLGRIAFSLATLGKACDHILQAQWWKSLLAGLARGRWGDGFRDANDREEAALMVIYREIPELRFKDDPSLSLHSLIEDRMEKFYFRRGLYLAKNLEPRAANRAGAA